MDSSFFCTLKNDRDFRRTYAKGKSLVCFCAVLYINKNYGKGLRIGVTVSKKIGNAVIRNRARRVIKAACRSFFGNKKVGNFDIVLVARGKTPYVKSYVFECCLAKLLAGVFNSCL